MISPRITLTSPQDHHSITSGTTTGAPQGHTRITPGTPPRSPQNHLRIYRDHHKITSRITLGDPWLILWWSRAILEWSLGDRGGVPGEILVWPWGAPVVDPEVMLWWSWGDVRVILGLITGLNVVISNNLKSVSPLNWLFLYIWKKCFLNNWMIY